MEYKEIALKCVDSLSDVDIAFHSKGGITLYVDTMDHKIDLDITEDSLREFATKILKELDNGISD